MGRALCAGGTPRCVAPRLAAGEDVKLGLAAQRIRPEPGTFDVVVHSDGDGLLVLEGGAWREVSPAELAAQMRADGFDGESVRLIACGSGQADGAAARLSRELGVDVKAPTDTVWIHPDGTLTVGPTPDAPTGGWSRTAPDGAQEFVEDSARLSDEALAGADDAVAIGDEWRLERRREEARSRPGPEEHRAIEARKTQRRVTQQESLERRTREAEERIANADGPLHPGADGRPRTGHGNADHGHGTTPEQHRERNRTGTSPSGRRGQRPTEGSARFDNALAQDEALRKGWGRLQDALHNGQVTPGLRPNGAPNRLTVQVQTDRAEGFGIVFLPDGLEV